MSKNREHFRRHGGFTLIELLVAIAVLGILITAAVPSVQSIIRDSRVTSQKNEIVALINLARNEAIRRNIGVKDIENGNAHARLRLVSTETPPEWDGSVSVTDADTAPDCSPGVIRCSDNANVSLTIVGGTSPLELSFESRGFLTPFQEKVMRLKHEPCAGTRQHVEIRVLGTGQIQTENLACGQEG